MHVLVNMCTMQDVNNAVKTLSCYVFTNALLQGSDIVLHQSRHLHSGEILCIY